MEYPHPRRRVFFLAAVLFLSTVLAERSQAQLIYVPQQSQDLLVVIHGCGQTARDMMVGTRFNPIAKAQKWAVYYPKLAHPDG